MKQTQWRVRHDDITLIASLNHHLVIVWSRRSRYVLHSALQTNTASTVRLGVCVIELLTVKTITRLDAPVQWRRQDLVPGAHAKVTGFLQEATVDI